MSTTYSLPGCLDSAHCEAINIVSNLVALLDDWLADYLLVSPVATGRPHHLTSVAHPVRSTQITMIFIPKTTGSIITFLCPLYLALVGTCSSTPQTGGNTLSQCPQSRNGDLLHIAHLATKQHLELSRHENRQSGVLGFHCIIPFTLLIAIRLILHSRNTRNALGTWIAAGGYTVLLLPHSSFMPLVGLRTFSY